MITINGVVVMPTIFPDKTSQVWKIKSLYPAKTNGFPVKIKWEFENEAEIVHLAQLRDLIRETTEEGSQVDLEIDYLPYARQDHRVSDETTFALRSFAKIINSIGFDFIQITDPHSSVANQLIHRSISYYPSDKFMDAVRSVGHIDALAYPDAGAHDKYRYMHRSFNYIFGKKVRDSLTGKIINYEIFSEDEDGNRVAVDAKGKVFLIVDDICDGGATFVNLAQVLYTQGAKEVHLFVTHGLFTQGLKPLKDAGIHKIFSKNGEHKQ